MATLFRRSFVVLAASALAMAALFAVAAVWALDRMHAGATGQALAEAAQALAGVYAAEAAAADPAGSADPVKFAAAAGAGVRVTIVDAGGKVLADSAADPAAMANHSGRPEIAAALGGAAATARRPSATIGMDLFYAAVPVPLPAGSPRIVLRLAVERPSLAVRLAPAGVGLAAALLLVALAAAAAAAAWSKSVAAPLSRLVAYARTLAAADGGAAGGAEPPHPAFAFGADPPAELKQLGAALADMAAALAARVREAREAGLERGAILDGMAEAVLSLDAGLAVRSANPAAAALFGFGPDVPGRGLLAATRSAELEAVAADCLAACERREAELALYGDAGERWFQVAATPLGAGGAGRGVVLVLGDITRLRRLERVRKDFVANVSHELRTPIQLIKGYAETLAEVAPDAPADPERTARGLAVIGSNAARMEALIDDLRSLAALERDGGALATAVAAVAPVLAAAVASVAPAAAAKGIAVSVDCPEDLEARINAGLLEQAIANLADNAVRYSPAGTPVAAAARREGDDLVVEVRDRGPGIPAADLPRIFERFYRVDRGRSRELGGTGLGLAIVKHICLAHGGDAAAESYLGEGSRFILRLPLAGPPTKT